MALPVYVFARHVRLSQRHWDALFGEDVAPTVLMPLADGEWSASAEVVTLRVEGEVLQDIRVYAPSSEQSQIILTRRDFSQLERPLPEQPFTPCGIACTVEGPAGMVVLADSVEFHPRHVTRDGVPSEAIELEPSVLVEGERQRTLSDVAIRRSPAANEALWLDVDDGQSSWVNASTVARIVRAAAS